MTIKEYMRSLRKQIPAHPTTSDWARIEPMYGYARAYSQGEEGLNEYRDRLIAKRINAQYNRDAQLAILFNRVAAPDEYEAYQAFRAKIKAEVDAEMAELASKIQTILAD